MHVTPVGELDVDSGRALNDVRAALGRGVAVVACDMRRLSFLDVAGLHHLLGLARDTHSRGVAFFTYNWQAQPRQLLDRTDELARPDGQGRHTAPTRPLRRTLRQAAESARAAGTARAADREALDPGPTPRTGGSARRR
ncbi:STAS domain-containing protein [Streptomyces sp. NBC_01233]|nr:STAS domain-containing protein [Streptomyces sp. NBC_01233]